MSRKFKLIRDREDDTPRASIQRHLQIAALIVAVPIVALLILSMFSGLSAARRHMVRENLMVSARMTQVAMPTRAPRPTLPPVTPIPTSTIPVSIGKTVKPNSLLRSGPGLDYAQTATLDGDQPIALVGSDASGKWYQVEGGAWISAGDILGYLPHLRVVSP